MSNRILTPRAARPQSALTRVSAAVTLALGLAATSAMAVPHAAAPVDKRISDLGIAAAGDVKTVTIGLAVRNRAALDAAVASVGDPASANFRKFITPEVFAATYGQTPASVAQVSAWLKSKGFSITKVHANNLLITVQATNAQIAAAFGTTIHSFTDSGVAYQAPATNAVIPAQFAGVISAVSGLSNRPMATSHRVTVPSTGVLADDLAKAQRTAGPLKPAANPPGFYTTVDVAAKYNINPLYGKGYTGAGKTIGIATLASYYQSDAYHYWSDLKLAVSNTRITDVLVDGGPTDGPLSEGAGETTLDVEQSGGIAPGADMRVYMAPNTGSGFVDVFAQAVIEDKVDVLSVSWGSPEIVNDGATLDLFHTIFEQAALQGIPIIAASGDAGAFDINRSYPYPACSTLLSVDFPAADPTVLAAGGTTLPNTTAHKFGSVTVATERAWSWDYLKDYIVTYYGTGLYYGSYLVVGGGGGVSVNFAQPSWQGKLTGTALSATAQTLICGPAVTGGAYADFVDMPSNATGRNLPDLSLNADPYSGYTVYESQPFNMPAAYSGNSGGTSFVAPQLNGIFTLISQGIPVTAANPKGRVGTPGPQLYAAFKKVGYGTGSPFKAITAGTNGYYKSTATYNPATGLGSLDVDALATTLGATAPH
jgi:subtilase family serine protease